MIQKKIIEYLTKDAREILKDFDALMEITGIQKVSSATDKWSVYTTDPTIRKPILTAHYDTINGNIGVSEKDIVKSKNIVKLKKGSKYFCLGADDRAGLAILHNVMCLRPDDYHFILFGQEETGGVGSSTFVEIEALDLNLNVSVNIGIDRRGKYHFVDYGFSNKDITTFLAVRGFDKEQGSYSDISTLADDNNRACINFATGYNNEHSTKETMDCSYAGELVELLTDNAFIGFMAKKHYKPVYKEPKFYGRLWDSNGRFEEIEDDYDDIEDAEYLEDAYWENQKYNSEKF